MSEASEKVRASRLATKTFVVLVFEVLILFGQGLILWRQTALMEANTSIVETQQKVATRPIILVSQFNPTEGVPSRSPGWKIENDGPYPVRDLRIQLLHFKKFVGLGWHVQAGGDTPLFPELGANRSQPLDLKVRADFAKQYEITGFKPERFADFVVIVIHFRRDLDDKHYLYLVPFQVLDDVPQMIRPEMTSIAGPLNTSCTMDAYAIELTFEYFRRNPMPYPVEAYNYHYLLGEPTSTCLETGSSSLRF